jgi:hypothetical protein
MKRIQWKWIFTGSKYGDHFGKKLPHTTVDIPTKFHEA